MTYELGSGRWEEAGITDAAPVEPLHQGRYLTHAEVFSILGEDAANLLFCRRLPDNVDLDNPGDFLWASKMAEERSAGPRKPLLNSWLGHD